MKKHFKQTIMAMFLMLLLASSAAFAPIVMAEEEKSAFPDAVVNEATAKEVKITKDNWQDYFEIIVIKEKEQKEQKEQARYTYALSLKKEYLDAYKQAGEYALPKASTENNKNNSLAEENTEQQKAELTPSKAEIGENKKETENDGEVEKTVAATFTFSSDSFDLEKSALTSESAFLIIPDGAELISFSEKKNSKDLVLKIIFASNAYDNCILRWEKENADENETSRKNENEKAEEESLLDEDNSNQIVLPGKNESEPVNPANADTLMITDTVSAEETLAWTGFVTFLWNEEKESDLLQHIFITPTDIHGTLLIYPLNLNDGKHSEDIPSKIDQNRTPDFKSFCWGDTQETVIAKEGNPLLSSEMTNRDVTYIAYNTTVAGKKAILAYYFSDQGLFTVRYILQESHSNENMYITDYEAIRSAITKKYGDPLFDFESWQDDSKKSYYANRKGDALSYGYLTYFTMYSLERTSISMQMSADNYEISTNIQFESKNISFAEADYSKDFKLFSWGDDETVVKNEMGKPYLIGEMNGVAANYIAYETQIVGQDVLVAYYFCKDGLYLIRYISQEKHSNENLFINDYEDIRDAITQLYGDPLIDFEKWQDDSKKSYYANRKGDALCYGYLTYMTLYSLDDMYISMSMSADNFDVSTTIEFESKTISPGEVDYSDDF